MTDLERAIHKACEAAGARPPKITHYANCIAVRIRNGDGRPVLITLDHGKWGDGAEAVISHKIAQAFKVKAENQPSAESLVRLEMMVSPAEVAAINARRNTLAVTEGCQYELRPDPNWDGYPEHAPKIVYCVTHSRYGGCSFT